MPRNPNGQAETPAFIVEFDLDNPSQQRAWLVAQRKAATYGVRKSLIMAFLNAIADFEEITGREMTTEMVSGLFIARAMTGVGMGDAPQAPETILDDEIIAVSSQKKTAAETANKFVGKMGNLFG